MPKHPADKKKAGQLPPPEAFEYDSQHDPNVLDRYPDEHVNELEDWITELESSRTEKTDS